jgi:NAD(P)-dependent dehydrogenase (short-subunit alcohol dehydrogenase family)
VQADVTKEADVKAMVDKAVGVFGRLDIAFNNAGTVAENPSLIEQTEAEYDRMMNVNVKGVWLSMKHEIAQMLKHLYLAPGNLNVNSMTKCNGAHSFKVE